MPSKPIDIKDRLVSEPMYSLHDADYLVGNSPGTTRRWLTSFPDLVIAAPEGLSYYAGLQLAAVAKLRRGGLSMKTIRDMLVFLQRDMGFQFPFLTEKFLTGGKQVFLDWTDTLVEVGRTKGQLSWADAIRPFLEELDFDRELAARWWPMGKKNLVLVSPDYGFGLPVIAGTFVRTEILRDHFSVVGSMSQVARDFDISEQAVENAIQFESQRQMAA